MNITYKETIMAGHGGQGILFMGMLLSHAAMTEGVNVTFFPSYGAEMRGGTANCTVIISKNEIGSPVSKSPDFAIIMNRPSLGRFLPRVKVGGMVFINSSLVSEEIERDDLRVIKVPATDIADKIGNIKVANAVALGSFIKHTQIVSLDSVIDGLSTVLEGSKKNLLDVNKKALEKGAELYDKKG